MITFVSSEEIDPINTKITNLAMYRKLCNMSCHKIFVIHLLKQKQFDQKLGTQTRLFVYVMFNYSCYLNHFPWEQYKEFNQDQ